MRLSLASPIVGVFSSPALPSPQLAQLDDKGWKAQDGLIGANAPQH